MNINATLFVQALSFAALIWFSVKFVWPMITNAMDDRARTIADGLAAAEAGRQSLARSASQAAVAIDDARRRAAEIVSQAEKRGAQLIEEAKASARTEADRERATARAELEQEVSQAREQLRQQLGSLVVAGVESILRREVDARAHAEMIESIRQRL
jgi:F-type H+-transporting ATPase subunit b